MKKLLYLLLLLPLGFLTSCHDDDDVPNVNLVVKLDNVGVKDNAVYAVQDTPITIEGVTCQGIGSDAVVTSVTYYWDNLVLFVPPISPYGVTFDTAVQTPGTHVLGINARIAQVDKSLGFAATGLRITIVETADDLPEGVELGQQTITFDGQTE